MIAFEEEDKLKKLIKILENFNSEVERNDDQIPLFQLPLEKIVQLINDIQSFDILPCLYRILNSVPTPTPKFTSYICNFYLIYVQLLCFLSKKNENNSNYRESDGTLLVLLRQR